MTPAWHFSELRPGNKDRQPTQGEFFATDAIKSPAEALVRESIQNSLDAALKNTGEPVRVRFSLGTGSDALSPLQANRYFASGWKHFTAKGNGLDDLPDEGDACRFLVVEDFGTSGLNGDIRQYRHASDTVNPFYYFFRTEGRSGKGEEDRGRWGIGKYVFPRSSELNAFIAVTVRSEDKSRILMGQAVLKSHSIGKKYFTPDGDYGQTGNGKERELTLPIEDQPFIDRFCEDFRLKREQQPGLSVVVPWVVPEINRDSLVEAVITNYFFVILEGALEVTVASGSSETVLTKESLESVVVSLGEKFASDIGPLLKLTRWSQECLPDSIIPLMPPKSVKWESGMVPKDQIDFLRQRLRAGERLAIQVPVTVKGGKASKSHERPSFFRMFLVQDGCDAGVPTFIRDGLLISDARRYPAPSVRSLVIVEDPPLMELLGDSENPAHTQWQRDRAHFKHKYPQGPACIEFVTRSVASFVRLLNESDLDTDKDLLKEIFSLARPAEDEIEPKKPMPLRKRNQGEPIAPEVAVEPRKKRFRIGRVPGGFRISRGDPDASRPGSLEIRVAYDRRRGSPIKKYDPADFELEKRPIEIATTGLEVTEMGGNRLTVRTVEADFSIIVTGFDENRDLIVDVQSRDETEEGAEEAHD